MLVSVILAAGAGSRVGGGKALLELGGIPILTRLLDASFAGGVDRAIVVTGSDADRTAALARRDGVIVAENHDWPDGQSSSLRVGMGALPAATTAFLIHPVDHALVRADHLRLLGAALAARAREPRLILRPVHAGQFGHPVLFTADFAAEFRALPPAAPGNTIYRRNIDRVVGIEMPDVDCSFDLDLPADLAYARERVNRRAE